MYHAREVGNIFFFVQVFEVRILRMTLWGLGIKRKWIWIREVSLDWTGFVFVLHVSLINTIRGWNFGVDSSIGCVMLLLDQAPGGFSWWNISLSSGIWGLLDPFPWILPGTVWNGRWGVGYCFSFATASCRVSVCNDLQIFSFSELYTNLLVGKIR